MIKISILADSLAMPRVDANETILFEETWPVQLDLKFRDTKYDKVFFAINSRRARTIDSLLGSDFYESIEIIKPKILIIQIGVVDSMPRIFSRREKQIIGHRFFPEKLKSFLINQRSRNRRVLTKDNPLKKIYTKPEKFESILDQFSVRVKKLDLNCRIVVLPILINQHIMEGKSPGSSTNRKLFNDILQKHAGRNNWIFLKIEDDKFLNLNPFLRDGYHLNFSGHQYISQRLEILIQEILENEND